MKVFLYFELLLLMLLVSCSKQVPQTYTAEKKSAVVYPDYNGITIPCNIAPLNFQINEDADEYVTRLYSNSGNDIVVSGKTIQFDLKDWKKLLNDNKGKTIHVDIFAKRNGVWYKYPTLNNLVATEPIDEYISYRLIE